ncbi:MAG: C-type lectin domain-containing protein [Verrucomicrobiota bacterium]
MFLQSPKTFRAILAPSSLIFSSMATLSAESVVWPTGPGANSHAYEVIHVPEGITWPNAEAQAIARGGHLASISSLAENNFVHGLIKDRPELWTAPDHVNNIIGPWLGGFQTSLNVFAWVDGSAFQYSNWAPGEPNNVNGTEARIHFLGQNALRASTWNDYPPTPDGALQPLPKAYIVERQLPAGDYAIWRPEDGGNGHTYVVVHAPAGIDWPAAEADAIARGGHLASVNSSTENAFLYSLAGTNLALWTGPDTHPKQLGPWLGGYESGPNIYRWTDGSPSVFQNWAPGEPNNALGDESRIHFYGQNGMPGAQWNDYPPSPVGPVQPKLLSYIVEFTQFPSDPVFELKTFPLSITWNSVNGCKIVLAGSASGRTYLLQQTSDFLHWEDLEQKVSVGVAISWQTPPQPSNRFFRVALLP